MPQAKDNDIGTVERVRGGVEGFLRAVFLDDWGVKLLALAVSLGLWFGVTGQRTPATIRLSNVQLSFRLPKELEIANEPPEKVDVIITGSKEALDRLNSRSLVAFVDISGYQDGAYTVRLVRETIAMDLPDGVHIDAIDPNFVPLRLESRQIRDVPVDVELTGKLASDYELRRVTLTPASVTLRGPASHVNQVARVRTENVSLDGLTSDTNLAQVPIVVDDKKITISEPVVGVYLKIGEQRVEKSFNGIAVRESSGRIARPQVAAVTVYGERSAVERLNSKDLQIILNVSSDGSITPSLSVPSGMEGRVELRSTQPAGFTIIK